MARDLNKLAALPQPACPSGYTEQQIETIFGSTPGLLDTFHKFMYGQTRTLCDGRLYNHEKRRYEPSPCANNPHGGVTYRCDVEQFLLGRPALD